MAKDKKRGFFSWLGFGQKEEEQQQPEPPVEPGESQAAETPAEPAAPEQVEPKPAPAQESEPAETAAAPIEPEAHQEGTPEEDNAQALAEEIVNVTEQVAAQAEAPKQEDTEPESELPAPERPVPEAPAVAPEVVPSENIAVVASVAAAPEAVQEAKDEEDTLAPAVTQEQERPTKEGFFARLKRSLVKTKQNLGSGFVGLFRGKKIDDDLFDELEEQLLIADVGVDTTRKIIDSLTQHASRKQLKDAEALYGKLKEEMSEILARVDQPLDISGKTPYVILMVGVNGVGKTTTIGKLARQFQAQGKSVMLAAGDTFRAAAVEQLQVWGDRNRIPVVAQHTGADSASVIFDALQAAKARGVDVLIADTAGRLQNKAHLMEELKKIVRVMKKLDEHAPHEVMLTLDASTGQNAVSQAKLFNEAVGLTGITLTKLDGTAKGGVIFAIADQFGIPIRYIGVGEGIEDLRPFKADDFIEALFARED
ncbi:MAG: signal recognition particle-docking protein FtsY [Gibbsiella quercinecans]|uniref:signal recognition particle-docking protein FtsY n=1 Tax=Gibbsiella quercinecans TaxID=929813 RepID=UPI003F3AE89F